MADKIIADVTTLSVSKGIVVSGYENTVAQHDYLSDCIRGKQASAMNEEGSNGNCDGGCKCGQNDCDLCPVIDKLLEANEWHYEWIWALQQHDEARYFVDEESQVKLKLVHKDDMASEIRSKLGSLQTTLVR